MKKISLTVASLSLLFGTALLAAPRINTFASNLSTFRALQTQASHAQNEQQPAAKSKTFMGTIAKSGDQFVLKADDGQTAYRLDDQQTAGKFEGKKVKVTGVLDASANLIRVQNIEEATS
jgi:hypothetical protein